MHSLKILFTPHLQKMYSIKETLALWKESYNKPGQPMKKQRHHFADKGSYSQRYGFSSSHVQMWELDHKEAWVLKNWCFELWSWRRYSRIPWTASRSNQSIPKEINPEYSLKGMMLKLRLQYFGHLKQKNRLIGKNSDAGKDWGQEEKEVTEEEVVGCHHWLSGYEFEQTKEESEGQRSLKHCSSWDLKELDMTSWPNSNNMLFFTFITVFSTLHEIFNTLW